jgi:ATP/maltotriose-dependent transcriptional regulator MalT
MAAAAWQQGEHAHPEKAVQVNTLLTLFRLLEGDQVGTLVDGLAAYVESSPLPAWHSGLAMAYAEVGRFDDAMEQVQTFVSTGLDTIPRDCVWYATTAMLTRALVRLDAPALCRDLYDLMLPFEDRNSVVGGAVLTFGPIAGLLGALAGACGEHDRALEHLGAAAERSRALGSEPLTARCELNTARVLLARGASGDADDAIRLLMRVTKTAEAIGMPRLLREVAELG